MSQWDWSQGPPPREPQPFGDAAREWVVTVAEKVGDGVLHLVVEASVAVAAAGVTTAVVWAARQVVMPGS
ncbi:MAG: hypothetical protein HY830_05805 [Actinobacteria bacterium]|nr:hypothetical protein [Actinomycetota bacterium]